MFYPRHIIIVLVISFCLAHAADKKQYAQLKELAKQYPILEEQMLATLPQFGQYCTSVDTTLIDRYVNIVKEILDRDALSPDEKKYIKKIAHAMTRGPIHRNGSASSRWRNAAKQALILTLSQTATGTTILDELAAHNPQLQAEREAYSGGAHDNKVY